MNDPLIGQQLANYRIERLLGRGGMAQVYYGWDVKLDRPVAIKVIDARYRDDPSYARRFVKEARVLAKWHHQHIIQIYYTDDEDGLYYYAMEYIDGENLATIMASYATDGELMPIEDVLRIGNAIAEALDYAHAQGVVHRDVKPSNILVARDGRVVLGDFGLALDMHDGSLGEAFGTPHYISPEQASRSANAVPQSDLYSLGVILYELLTGAVPFSDPSPTSVALQHITDVPPSPRSVNPDLNAEPEAVLLKALDKSPQRRYQTGAELLVALKNAITPGSKSGIPPLPPLPVDVPTIAHRIVSKQSVTERVASRPPAEIAPTIRGQENSDPIVFESKKKRFIEKRSSNKFMGAIFLSLIVLAGLVYALSSEHFRMNFFPLVVSPSRIPSPIATIPAKVVLPTSTATETEVPTVTLTDFVNSPSPTSTSTLMPQPTNTETRTAKISPTVPTTQTGANPPSPASTPSALVLESSATEALAVNRFMLYYNDNSFYIHNLSRVTRSNSGFSFEQLDDQDKPIVTFEGWRWDRYFTKIFPNRCMAIELYQSTPFLKPPECIVPYLSLLNPARDTGLVFWTPQENSQQFRVLWLDEEAGRCEISAGSCEIFVP